MIFICYDDKKYNIIVNEFYNKIVKINKNIIILNNLLCLTENTRETDIYICFGLQNWYQDYNKMFFPKYLIVVQLEYYIQFEFSINYINILKKSYKILDFYKENIKLYDIFNFNLSNILNLDIEYKQNDMNIEKLNIVKPIDILYYGKMNEYMNSIQQLLINSFEDKYIVFIDDKNETNDVELENILSQSKILLLLNSENIDNYLDIQKLMLYIHKTKYSYIISSQIRNINDIKKFENVDFVLNNNLDIIIRKCRKYFENFRNDPICYIKCNEINDKDYYDLMYKKITSEKKCNINFKLDILQNNFLENNFIENYEKSINYINKSNSNEEIYVSILTIIKLDIVNYKKRVKYILEKFDKIYDNYDINKYEWIFICNIQCIKNKNEILQYLEEQITKLEIRYKIIICNGQNSLLKKQIGIQNCNYNYISLFYYIEKDIENDILNENDKLINKINYIKKNKNIFCVNNDINNNQYNLLKENFMLFDKERFLQKELIKHQWNDFYSNILYNRDNVGVL